MQGLMTVILAGTLAGVLFMISAMNQPFGPQIRVEPGAILHAIEQFNTLSM